MRQQRAPNWRGKVQKPSQYPYSSLPWSLAMLDTQHAELTPPIGSPQLIIIQPPLATRNGGIDPIAEAHMIGNVVHISWAAPFGPALNFELKAGDPGVRTKQGLYLAPGFIPVVSLPYPQLLPPPADWSLFNAAGNTIVIQTVQNMVYATATPSFFENAQGSNPLSSSLLDTNNLLLTYPGPVNPGDTITFAGDSTVITDQPGLLKPQTQTV